MTLRAYGRPRRKQGLQVKAPGGVTVAYDASAISAFADDITTISWAHTIGAGVTNGAVVAFVFNSNDETQPSSVTLGGQAMTLLGEALLGGDEPQSLFAYGLKTGSAHGTEELVATFPSAKGGAACSLSASGVGSFGSANDFTSGGTTLSSASVALAVPAGGLVVGGVGNFESTAASIATSSGATNDKSVFSSSDGCDVALAHTTASPLTWNVHSANYCTALSVALLHA
jgi:hypothetical protein